MSFLNSCKGLFRPRVTGLTALRQNNQRQQEVLAIEAERKERLHQQTLEENERLAQQQMQSFPQMLGNHPQPPARNTGATAAQPQGASTGHRQQSPEADYRLQAKILREEKYAKERSALIKKIVSVINEILSKCTEAEKPAMKKAIRAIAESVQSINTI